MISFYSPLLAYGVQYSIVVLYIKLQYFGDVEW